MQASVSIWVGSVTSAVALAAARCVTFAGGLPAAGAAVFGVTRSAGLIGDLVPVDVIGSALIESSDVVTAGGPVMVAADGRVLDKTGVNIAVGRALTGAAAAGTLCEVLLFQTA